MAKKNEKTSSVEAEMTEGMPSFGDATPGNAFKEAGVLDAPAWSVYLALLASQGKQWESICDARLVADGARTEATARRLAWCVPKILKVAREMGWLEK